MARLIDADRFLRNTRFRPGVYPHKTLKLEIEEQPTVDAVEVVHGRWIWSEENGCWVCSNCEMSALNNYRGNSTDSNYCPNCGARMDGDSQ